MYSPPNRKIWLRAWSR